MKTIIIDNRFVLSISQKDFTILEMYRRELKISEKSENEKDEEICFGRYSKFKEELKRKYKPIKIDLKA